MSLKFYSIRGIEGIIKEVPVDLTIDYDEPIVWTYAPSNYLYLIDNISKAYRDYPLVYYLDDKILFESFMVDKLQLIAPLIRLNGERPKWVANKGGIFKRKSISLFLGDHEIIMPAYGYKPFGRWKAMYQLLKESYETYYNVLSSKY